MQSCNYDLTTRVKSIVVVKLAAAVLAVWVTHNLNAMPYARPVSRTSSSIVSEIITALNNNRYELALRHLRDNGLSINSQLTEKHETVLHLVAKLGKQEIAEKLLAQGTLINARDRKGKTPLDYAQNNGHTQLAELLQTYAQKELATLQNTTKPQDLFEAASNNDRAGAKLLLTEGADPWEKKHTTYKTPFHIAFEAEHYSLAAFLLKAAQGINGLDEKGWTPLMLAIVADDWDMVRELIKDGADPIAGHRENALDVAKMMGSEARLVDIFVAERRADGVVHTYGETIPFIELAFLMRYKEVVKLLRQHGADPVREYSLSPLLKLAKSRKNWEMVLATIKRGGAKVIDVFVEEMGSVNAPLGNFNSDTLLTLAAKTGDTEIVKLLIDNNADLNITNAYGYTALIWAAQEGHTDIVELLIDNNANLNIQDKHTHTALIWAAQEGHMEIVGLLIDNNANLNIQDKHGYAALIYAAREGHTDIVKLLIDSNADLNIKSDYGNTALMFAAREGHTDIVELLVANKAKLNIKNRYGESALTVAKRITRHQEIIDILRAAQNEQVVEEKTTPQG